LPVATSRFVREEREKREISTEGAEMREIGRLRILLAHWWERFRFSFSSPFVRRALRNASQRLRARMALA